MKRVLNLKRGARNLNLRDVNEISKVAWEEAFKQENNVKGWATCGLYPFTRRPMWELHAEEQATATAMEGHSELNIDYSQVSMADILHSDSEEEESGEDDDPEFGGPRKRRLTSAQIWAMEGGCTGPEAMRMVREKYDARRIEEEAREAKRVERAAAAAKVDDEAKRAALPIVEAIEAGTLKLDRLTKVQMCSLLVFFDAVPVGMRTKKKDDLLQAVKAVPRLQVLLDAADGAPPLPPPPPHSRRRHHYGEDGHASKIRMLPYCIAGFPQVNIAKARGGS